MTDGPYARLYLSLVDDPKFTTIYDDDHHFAAWCRLLMIAEPSWPASAHLPSIVRPSSVRALVDAGLIDIQPGGRYRVHGLDAERGDRHQQARKASNARWNARSNARSIAGASDVRMPNRTEPNLTESNRAETREIRPDLTIPDDGRADLEAFLLVNFRAPTPKQRTFMDGYCRVFDATGPERAARLILSNPTDAIGAMKADLEAFRATRSAEAAASEVPKPAPRRAPSTLTRIGQRPPDVSEEEADRIAREYMRRDREEAPA